MNPPTSETPKPLSIPLELLPPEEVFTPSSGLGHLSSLAVVLDCMPDWVMILNEQRKIVFGNKALRDLAGRAGGQKLARPNAGELPDRRSAGSAITGCGVVQAILGALAGHDMMHECRITTPVREAGDLRIWSSPFRWLTGRYVLVVAVDISNEKRCQVLEKIFFHDLLNTAANVHGLSELIRRDPGSAAEFTDDLHETAEELVNEIRTQRLLLAAERDELQVRLVPANSRELLESVVLNYRHHRLSTGKVIVLAPGSANFIFQTDKTLMHRVLGNLLNNALEASKPGETIELGAEERPDRFVFWCHNPLAIPHALQLQLFQRDFSTKGPGRGIGTYSIKLLTEHYLGGTVAVVSTPETGTRFELSFPKDGRPGLATSAARAPSAGTTGPATLTGSRAADPAHAGAGG